MKLHMQHQDKFDSTTLLGMSGPVKGEYYGLPWPCWGDAEMKHPGTPILWDPSKPEAEGGIPFRARWGVEHGVGKYGQEGEVRSLLAESSAPEGAELEDGYPEFTMAMLTKLGWAQDLTEQERQTIQSINGEKTNWKTDLSGGIQRVAIAHGCAPFGNGKARALVWNFPDPVPIHREPLYTPRRDLVEEYRTYDDHRDYRLPTLYWGIQKENFADRFPLVLISGRLVEYEGGGDETRSNKWLAEFQQQMFAEVNPDDARAAGIEHGAMMWVSSPEGSRIRVQALVTHRVGPGTVFLPFHFGGFWQGADFGGRYPEGTVPFVLGESANTVGTYGYDVVTFMQESKGTLCRIETA